MVRDARRQIEQVLKVPAYGCATFFRRGHRGRTFLMMYRRITLLSLRVVAAALCGAVMAACSANGDNAVSDCTLGACEGPTDAARASITVSPRAPKPLPTVDTGPTRNLLCGVSGCDPGNVSACGVPVVDGGPYGFPTGDAQVGDAKDADSLVGDAGQDGGPTSAVNRDADATQESSPESSTGALADAAPHDSGTPAHSLTPALATPNATRKTRLPSCSRTKVAPAPTYLDATWPHRCGSTRRQR